MYGDERANDTPVQVYKLPVVDGTLVTCRMAQSEIDGLMREDTQYGDLHFILDDANGVVPVWIGGIDETNPITV